MRKWNDLQLSFDPELFPDFDADETGMLPGTERQISEAARKALTLRLEGGETPAWLEDYLKLIEQGWPWRIACYIAWASSPKKTRHPRTLADLAMGVLGLSGSRTIHAWRQKYATIDQTVAMMQAAPLWEHRRDVLEALVASATTEDYKNFNDRKLFLEMTGDYVPRSQIEVGQSVKGDESDLTDEELRALAGKATTEALTPDPSPEGRGEKPELSLKGEGKRAEDEDAGDGDG